MRYLWNQSNPKATHQEDQTQGRAAHTVRPTSALPSGRASSPVQPRLGTGHGSLDALPVTVAKMRSRACGQRGGTSTTMLIHERLGPVGIIRYAPNPSPSIRFVRSWLPSGSHWPDQRQSYTARPVPFADPFVSGFYAKPPKTLKQFGPIWHNQAVSCLPISLIRESFSVSVWRLSQLYRNRSSHSDSGLA